MHIQLKYVNTAFNNYKCASHELMLRTSFPESSIVIVKKVVYGYYRSSKTEIVTKPGRVGKKEGRVREIRTFL